MRWSDASSSYSMAMKNHELPSSVEILLDPKLSPGAILLLLFFASVVASTSSLLLMQVILCPASPC
jgi:hypothetical protein